MITIIHYKEGTACTKNTGHRQSENYNGHNHFLPECFSYHRSEQFYLDNINKGQLENFYICF